MTIALLFMNPAPIADVPITLRGVHIYVPARVNGQGPFPLNVDTGGITGISAGLARRLGVTSAGDVVVGGAGSGTVTFGKAKGLTFRIGGVEIANLDGTIDGNSEGAEAGIGAALFRRYTVEFDYDRMRMRLYAKGTVPQRSGATAVPLRFQRDGHKPLVPVRIGKKAGWFMADTGGGVSLILQRDFWRTGNLGRPGKPPIKTIVGFGIGGPIWGRVGRGPELRIGEIAVPGMVVSYSEMTQGSLANPERDGLLGQRILRRFNAVFDYAHARLMLTPNRTFGTPMPFSQTGLAGLVEGLGYQVSYVIPGSPGAEAGLRAGDVIVAVEGKVLDETGYRSAFNAPRGTRRALRVLRENRTFETAITLREVLE